MTYFMTSIVKYGIKILILSFSICSSFQSIGQTKPPKKEKKKIISQIDSVFKVDQKYRIPILYGTMDQHKIDSMSKLPREEINKIRQHAVCPELTSFRDSLFTLMSQDDVTNFNFITSLIDSIGYPSFHKQKWKFLIVIEHSLVYNPQYIDTLRKFVNEQHISPYDYTTIYDRYRHVSGEPLVYYTRRKYKNISCNVCREANKAREEIGMKTMLKCYCDINTGSEKGNFKKLKFRVIDEPKNK